MSYQNMNLSLMSDFLFSFAVVSLTVGSIIGVAAYVYWWFFLRNCGQGDS
jgi:hypothetical protein